MPEPETIIINPTVSGDLPSVKMTTGKVFRVVVTPRQVLLRLHDAEREPMSSTPFRVRIGEATTAEGSTDSDGFAAFELPHFCPVRVTVEWGEHDVFPFAFSTDIFPDCSSGSENAKITARLNNLGYSPEGDLEAAVIQFQIDYLVDHEPHPLGLVEGKLPPDTEVVLDKLFHPDNDLDARPIPT